VSSEYEVRSTKGETLVGASAKPQADLVAWQKAMDMVVAVYGATKDFPKKEEFGLMRQTERAAVSVPSNIAEGHGRNSERDFLRFLSIAHGSLREVETQVEVALRLDYITTDVAAKLAHACDDTGRPLRGLMQHLRTRLERQGIKRIGEDNDAYDV